MLKYKVRKFFFGLFRYSASAFLIITGKDKKKFNYNYEYFRFLKFFKKKFTHKINNALIEYDPLHSGIGWPMYFTGSFEDEELSVCSRFIKKDSVIFDIGANIGLHSVYFATIATEGLIYSYEPSKFTFSYLLRNIKDFNNILPLSLALSNKNSTAVFFDCENDALSGLKNTQRSDIRKQSRVSCLKGDDFINCTDLNKLDFIKIDVEGFETEVIEGLESTIRKYQPVIFCEIYKGLDSNNDPEKTISLLLNMGYNAYVVSGYDLKAYVSHNDAEHNYFFVHKNYSK